MKNWILNQLIIILILTIPFGHAMAQGDLQFNRVVNLSAGQSYTVPSGKVFKIESIVQSNSNYSIPFTGCTTEGAYYYCTYKAALISFGSYADSISYTATQGTNTCNCSPTYNASQILPTMSFPFWLPAGQSVSISSGTTFFLSGIEFNIVSQ